MSVPQPGTEPMSPALRDGFFTTDNQGSPFCFSVSKPQMLLGAHISAFCPHPQPHSFHWLRPLSAPQERFFLQGLEALLHPLWAQLNNSARGFPPPTQCTESPFVKYTLVYICNHQANCLVLLLLKAVGDNRPTGGCRTSNKILALKSPRRPTGFGHFIILCFKSIIEQSLNQIKKIWLRVMPECPWQRHF